MAAHHATPQPSATSTAPLTRRGANTPPPPLSKLRKVHDLEADRARQVRESLERAKRTGVPPAWVMW